MSKYLETRLRLFKAACVYGITLGPPPQETCEGQKEYELSEEEEDLLDAAVQFAKLVDDGEVEKE